MPYVAQEAREYWDFPLGELMCALVLVPEGPISVGDLTYIITMVVDAFLMGRRGSGRIHFEDYADAIAALECSKLELYRRKISVHEDTMVRKNGDVYAS